MSYTPERLQAIAERLRKTDVGMSNYTTVLNDAFVAIRELSRLMGEAMTRIAELESKQKE